MDLVGTWTDQVFWAGETVRGWGVGMHAVHTLVSWVREPGAKDRRTRPLYSTKATGWVSVGRPVRGVVGDGLGAVGGQLRVRWGKLWVSWAFQGFESRTVPKPQTCAKPRIKIDPVPDGGHTCGDCRLGPPLFGMRGNVGRAWPNGVGIPNNAPFGPQHPRVKTSGGERNPQESQSECSHSSTNCEVVKGSCRSADARSSGPSSTIIGVHLSST